MWLRSDVSWTENNVELCLVLYFLGYFAEKLIHPSGPKLFSLQGRIGTSYKLHWNLAKKSKMELMM